MSPIQLTIWQTDDPNDHISQCMQCTRKGFNRLCRCCLVLSPFQFIALSRKWVATIVCEMANKGQYVWDDVTILAQRMSKESGIRSRQAAGRPKRKLYVP